VKRIGRLHTLTDTSFQTRFDHVELAERMISGGTEVIQYRDKGTKTNELIETARTIAGMCRAAGVTFIINDRIDVALASDADGVHLGREDFPVALARRILGPDRIIGASVDTPEEGDEAWRAGADYVGFGPVFPSSTKADTGPVLNIGAFAERLPRFRLPVIGIGGIDCERAESVLDAGAHGVAVLAAVCCAESPAAATRRLREIVDRTAS
jgi:thiamine-phosphate pyrophosphorylase